MFQKKFFDHIIEKYTFKCLKCLLFSKFCPHFAVPRSWQYKNTHVLPFSYTNFQSNTRFVQIIYRIYPARNSNKIHSSTPKLNTSKPHHIWNYSSKNPPRRKYRSRNQKVHKTHT